MFGRRAIVTMLVLVKVTVSRSLGDLGSQCLLAKNKQPLAFWQSRHPRRPVIIRERVSGTFGSIHSDSRRRSVTQKAIIKKSSDDTFLSKNQFRTWLHSTAGDPPVVTPNCTRGHKPLEWEELYAIILVNKNLSALCRSQDIEERYSQHRKEVLQMYDSIYDYILHSKFDLPRTWNTQTERWCVRLETRETKELITLVPNDFPYFTAPGIQHWVLWKWGGEVSNDDLTLAFSKLRHDHQLQDIIHWENPPHLKSLPDINHFHILAKK